MTSPLLEVRGACKRFPGVVALDTVSLHVNAGEVLALVGENGAGKSTLMKILAGVYQPDDGQMFLDGQPVKFAGVNDAMAAGISLIHQELNLAENLGAAANIFLGREKLAFGGLLKNAEMAEITREFLTRVGLSADLVHVPVGRLAPGQKQLVEIARALSLKARVIIMDEPTSSLTQRETDRLYEVIDGLRASGVAIIYITHRMAEIKRLADRVTVFRDGKNSGELAKAEITHGAMVRLMVGRDLKHAYPRTENRTKTPVPVLEVRNVRYRGGPVEGVSFKIFGGEIVGMAGLVGAGRTELAEALFGLRPITGGEVLIDGHPIAIHHPKDAVKAGLLMAPEDRRLNGLVLEKSVGFNFSLPNMDLLSRNLLVKTREERTTGLDLIQRLRVKTPSLSQVVGLLSGGNQQKVVLGKWLARKHRVLILDEPTRGVDVGARSEIYALMDQLALEGVAVWMISSDLEEVLGMSDRVLVLHEGKLAGELPRAGLSEQVVMNLATGSKEDLAAK
ncbi:sugar ABC transporter ATP-binding protein [Zavarzinella formosa]|uniref:sugar ABC transporter ATP-binding protein n=1 Tax=Zavarzinella formosa TaxID=360055 RepID=UPI0002D8A690|nr:sugar ABC transporter ATP-binding protein [Zavarzinella formosa]